MNNQATRCSTGEVIDGLKNGGATLIDVRPVDAYNGWRMQNELRGGHIRGAKSLPAKWTKYIDWIEIVRSKGLSRRDKLILYGYEQDLTEKVARRFIKAGYRDVGVYHDFIQHEGGDRQAG